MYGGLIVIVAHPQLGQTPEDCAAMAESGRGAFSYDAFGTACWAVYGKRVLINPLVHDVQQGFEIVNLNFHTNGSQPPLPTQEDLPGPVFV